MLIDGEIQDPDVQKEFYNTINEEPTRLSSARTKPAEHLEK